ncbi:hypothetical protein [Nioella aestuarii]|uniref:hypothetical protein n=1 Tax=Nioella aestuarii TaxID=1662864 RepID=UPI003D7F9E57
MDRRLFTAGLAAGAVSGLATPSTAFLNQLEDDDRIELLQIPNLRHLNTLFRNAPRVMSDADLDGISQRGLSLIVTPRLNTQEGRVQLNIRGVVKNLSQSLITSDATAAGAPRVGDTDLEFSGNVYATGDPGILIRRAQTQVTVRDGETIIIGGLMHQAPRHGVETDLSLPFLGDLPVIGHAFRSSANTNRHSELVIFVTARLVRPE